MTDFNNVNIKLKRGTQADLSTVNPIPLDGEPVFNKTDGTLVIGDGVTAYNSLEKIGKSAPIATQINNQSTNDDAAGAKAVYDTVVASGQALIETIDADYAKKTDIPDTSSFVTRTTDQSISGRKIFSSGAGTNGSLTIKGNTSSNNRGNISFQSYQNDLAGYIEGGTTGSFNYMAMGPTALGGTSCWTVIASCLSGVNTLQARGTLALASPTCPKFVPITNTRSISNITSLSSHYLIHSGALNTNDFTVTESGGDLTQVSVKNRVKSTTITNMVKLTQAEYDALTTPDANTFYVIVN